MSEPGWHESGGRDPFENDPPEIDESARERRHTMRLVVLAVLGAVVIALMFALVAPGLFG